MIPRIEDLFREDGTVLRGGGENRYGLCPFHEEKSPSLSVNVDKQVYNCKGCGAKGNVYQYLVEVRHKDKKEAFAIVNDGATSQPAKSADARKKNPKPSLPSWRIADHPYRDAEGKTLFVVCRYAESQTQPKVNVWKPVEGGWVGGMPEFENGRPLYRLPELLAAPVTKQVMVVEGEKCVDSAVEAFPDAVATTWAGGEGNAHHTDMNPLQGRRLLLVSDSDKKGRACMLKLAALMSEFCPEIRIALPPGDSKDDIHDWLEQGGVPKARAKLSELSKSYETEKAKESTAEKAKQKPVEIPPDKELTDNRYFKVLGNLGDGIAIMLATHRIMYISRASTTQASTLISLADLNWWLNELGVSTLFPNICQPVGSAIIRAADRRGQIDLGKVVGRGAFWLPDSRLAWHMGDRLVIHGKEADLGVLGGGLMALSGPRVELSREVATPDDRKRLTEAIMRCCWASPNHCKRFLGWLVSSVIGGALEWRPHAWIAALPGSGKSWLLEHVAQAVVGDMGTRVADPSVAGLARRMGSDSFPVLLDEAEPDRAWVEGLLDYIRIAAGGDGERIRADGKDAVQSFQPRFSAMLSSVKMPQLGSADESRFCIIELDRTKQEDQNWPAVRQEIKKCIQEPWKIKAALVQDGQELAEKVNLYSEQAMLQGMNSRSAMISGALSVGWEWWSGIKEIVHMKEVESEPSSQSEADSVELLRDILGIRLRSHSGEDRSVANILQDGDKAGLCLDYGIRIMDGNLVIAPKHPSLRAKLGRSRWKNVDIRKALGQIEGVNHTTHALRFGGLRMYAVEIPESVCGNLGIEIYVKLQEEELKWE